MDEEIKPIYGPSPVDIMWEICEIQRILDRLLDEMYSQGLGRPPAPKDFKTTPGC